MTKPPETFRAIIELWSTRKAMAADVGVGGGDAGFGADAVSKWWRRDSIPAEWWSAVCATDAAKVAGVTTDLLAQLAANELAAGEPAEARP